MNIKINSFHLFNFFLRESRQSASPRYIYFSDFTSEGKKKEKKKNRREGEKSVTAHYTSPFEMMCIGCVLLILMGQCDVKTRQETHGR